jgi:hypothetical protein
MNRIIVGAMAAVLLLAFGILVGWQVHRGQSEHELQQARFVAELDRIAAQTANLQLIESDRVDAMKRMSEQRLFEAIDRADHLVGAGVEMPRGAAFPNLTEAAGRAAAYAKSNAAPRQTSEQAERLHAWLRAQMLRLAT